MEKRRFRRLHVFLFALLATQVASALEFRDHYSPWNRQRGLRPQTRYIVLHTTEGPSKGSLEKLYRYGEAHYMVDPGGLVFRVIDRRKVAMHAGRSMWAGLTNLDDYSIGIEVVGFHNQNITEAQIKALRELLQELKTVYKVPDENIMPHSMVAYGVPNRWHKHSHRGRKRCGLLFAKRSLRERLGLKRQPLFDPDVKAGRLVNADPYLAAVLFGSAQVQAKAVEHFTGDDALVIASGRSAWDIARDQYSSANTLYRFPDGTEMRGDQVKNWKSLLPGTRVVLSAPRRENESEGLRTVEPAADGTVADLAGDEALSATTLYFLADGKVRPGVDMTRGQVNALPADTRVLVGYVHGGYVTAKRSAFNICGTKWNTAATLYRLKDGRILTGEQIPEGKIPPMTMVFFQQ